MKITHNPFDFDHFVYTVANSKGRILKSDISSSSKKVSGIFKKILQLLAKIYNSNDKKVLEQNATEIFTLGNFIEWRGNSIINLKAEEGLESLQKVQSVFEKIFPKEIALKKEISSMIKILEREISQKEDEPDLDSKFFSDTRSDGDAQ